MISDNEKQSKQKEDAAQPASAEQVKNPFENNQSAEQDVQQSKEEVEKEQQFKEALRERD